MQHSQLLTTRLLQDRFDEHPVSYCVRSQAQRVLDSDFQEAPEIWVFAAQKSDYEEDPYEQLLDALGAGLRDMRNRFNIDRPMRVYEGHKYSLRDFLDLEDDGGVAFVHQAHRMKRVRFSHTEDYFRTFMSPLQS